MRAMRNSDLPHSGGIACGDVDWLTDDRNPELLGRKRWSTGDGGEIIELNQERETVKWVAGIH